LSGDNLPPAYLVQRHPQDKQEQYHKIINIGAHESAYSSTDEATKMRHRYILKP
jgi:hypothetical protein